MKKLNCILIEETDYSENKLKDRVFEKTLAADVVLDRGRVVKNVHGTTANGVDGVTVPITVNISVAGGLAN